jgi:hypothetical protein
LNFTSRLLCCLIIEKCNFQVVVIIVIWIISLLVIYMLFLICLDPLLNKRAKGSYQEHTNEEVYYYILYMIALFTFVPTCSVW